MIVTLLVNSTANGLPPGTYNDTASFTNTTSGDGNTARAVQLSIAGPQQAVMVVTPLDGFSSSGLVGGPFSPVSLQYAVSNVGDSPLDLTIEHGTGGNWLSLCHTVPGHYDELVTIAINDLARALGPGVYQDTIRFTNIVNGQGNTTRAAQLAVLTPGNLWVAPADGLSSTGQVGGPFTPSSKQYSLTNTGGAPINWTASHNALVSWVSLSGDFRYAGGRGIDRPSRFPSTPAPMRSRQGFTRTPSHSPTRRMARAARPGRSASRSARRP